MTMHPTRWLYKVINPHRCTSTEHGVPTPDGERRAALVGQGGRPPVAIAIAMTPSPGPPPPRSGPVHHPCRRVNPPHAAGSSRATSETHVFAARSAAGLPCSPRFPPNNHSQAQRQPNAHGHGMPPPVPRRREHARGTDRPRAPSEARVLFAASWASSWHGHVVVVACGWTLESKPQAGSRRVPVLETNRPSPRASAVDVLRDCVRVQ